MQTLMVLRQKNKFAEQFFVEIQYEENPIYRQGWYLDQRGASFLSD
jgi:hypothetical protein